MSGMEHAAWKAEEGVTPVEERIDHEEAKRIAENAHVYVMVGHRICDLSGMETAVLRDAYLDLLTEHFAREEVVRIAARISTQPRNHIRHDDLSDLQKAVAALPATESAQPEEERRG